MKIVNLMRFVILVVMDFAHSFSITFTGQVGRVTFADIFQVARPVATGSNIQNKAVIVGVIRTRPCQDEVIYKGTLVQ